MQSKAILLNDMLHNAREGERLGLEGDVYDQVAQACRGARPRIQKWIEEDTGEREGVMGMCPTGRADIDRLLLCNDLINNALERFEACKAGDWAKAQQIVDSTNPNQKAADLISFDAFADDEPMSGDGGLALPTATSAPSTSSGLPLDLFSAPSPSPTPAPAQAQQKQDPMAFFNTTTPFVPASSMQPMGYAVPSNGSLQQPRQMQPVQPTPPQPAQAQPKKDAFADLVDLMD